MSKHCLTVLPNSSGQAVERIRLEIVNLLQRNKKDISLYLVRNDNPKSHLLNGLKIFENSNVISFIKRLIFLPNGVVDILSFIDIVSILSNYNIDTILSAKTPTNYACIIAKIFSNKNVKVVCSIHIDPEYIGKNKFNKLIIKYMSRWVYSHCDCIIAPSEGVKLAISRHYKIDINNISVINNPINKSAIKSLRKDSNNINKIYSGEYIVSVGRLEDQKDYKTLLYSYKYSKSYYKYKLVIVGGGSKRSEIENIICRLGISERVILTGRVENPHPIINDAKLLVLSSRYEGFGNVIVEAMSHGVNIVSTNCPYGPSEILEDGNLGRLVPVCDFKALAQAIDNEISEPTTSPNHLKSEANKYDIHNIVNKYKEVIYE